MYQYGLFYGSILVPQKEDVMDSQLLLLKEIVPDIISLVEHRLNILTYISRHQPIGRRSLTLSLGMSERRLRRDIDQLKELGLVNIEKSGVTLTDKAAHVIMRLTQLFSYQEQLQQKELMLAQLYGITSCRIVPGDCEQDDTVFKVMGEAVSDWLDYFLPEGENIISVTGGTTLARVLPHVSKELTINRKFKVIPARGGGSGSPVIQATTVSHDLASLLNGETETLFVPEQLSVSLLDALKKDPNVMKTLALLKKSNCLIYSVGEATVMSKRRSVSDEEAAVLIENAAVGEAMGVFFDETGRIVHRLARIGLELEDLHDLPCEVLVVGGASKSIALSAYMKLAPRHTVLIVDEALANSVLKEVTL